MSIEIINFFKNDKFRKLDSTEKIIYLIIFYYDDNDELLTISKLTKLTGMQRLSIDNAVNRLIKKKIIIKSKQMSVDIERKIFYVYLKEKLNIKQNGE